MSLGNSMNDALKSIARPEIVFYAYVASAVACLASGIPLIIHFGLLGAVYGMIISAIIYTIVLGLGFTVLIVARSDRAIQSLARPQEN
jgi:hypothetical protein